MYLCAVPVASEPTVRSTLLPSSTMLQNADGFVVLMPEANGQILISPGE